MLLQNLQTELIEAIFSEGTKSTLTKSNLVIYKNTILDNLQKTMQSIYPMVKKLVGENFFYLLADEYIKRYPSRSANLNDYGEYFQHFLAEHTACKELDYLSEVAYLEWICHSLYFAANPSPFNFQNLSTISCEDYHQLSFSLHPASHIHKFVYPILRIIALCQGEIDESIDLHEGGVFLFMVRRELEIMLVELSEAEYIFLNALNNHQPISHALSAAKKLDPQFSLEEKLSQWIKDKTLVDFHLINKT